MTKETIRRGKVSPERKREQEFTSFMMKEADGKGTRKINPKNEQEQELMMKRHPAKGKGALRKAKSVGFMLKGFLRSGKGNGCRDEGNSEAVKGKGNPEQ